MRRSPRVLSFVRFDLSLVLAAGLTFSGAGSALANTLAAAAPSQAPPASTPSPEQQKLIALYEQCSRLIAGGDFAGVVSLLEPLAHGDSFAPPFRTQLAIAYLELDRPSEAAAALAPIADRDDAGAPLLLQASRAAQAMGQQAKADAYLARAAARDPGSLAARELGMQRGAEGKMDEACRLLRPYVAAHPDDAPARLSAAFCSVELGDREAAAALVDGLPATEPRVTLVRARIAVLAGKPDEVIALLEPLAASPPEPIAHELRRNLAESYIAVGRAQAAIPLLEGHVAGDPTLTLLLARAQQQSGRPADVLKTVAPFAAQMTAPSPPAGVPAVLMHDLALEWGRALLALQRWPEAVTALQAATRLDPKNAAAWQALVQALRGAGRTEEAKAAMAQLQAVSGARH
jgi:thioredoxin-like negative regulator of GroEL